MQQGISTHVVLPQRLTPGLLESLRVGGARVIEVFASRHHFDYTDRAAVREMAGWFRSNDVGASMHMPLFGEEEEAEWSRHTAASLNLIDGNKNARIEAMDEVKRALEAAEQVPFKTCVLHLGLKDDAWDSRALDDALTAIEHLKAFAAPLGVTLLLENLNNAVATPEHLVEIVTVGHFDTVGFCLDVGHAHLAATLPERSDGPAMTGLQQAFAAFGERVRELHLHDNGGAHDDHLWPGDGTVDWGVVRECVAGLKAAPVGVLEIGYGVGEELEKRVGKAFEVVGG